MDFDKLANLERKYRRNSNLIVASKNLGLSVSLFFKRVIVKGMTVTVVVALVACIVKESADYLLLSELWVY